MKKFFIAIAALALVASAACTKTNPEETKSEKISFQVANYMPQTKANVSLVGETTTFRSKAYLHAVGFENEDPQNFFGENGETITANNATNPSEWLPSHDYYWPKSSDSYINFVSWYDKKSAPTTSTETKLEWAGRTIATDDNIMWADEAWRFNKNQVKPDANGYWKDAVTEGVPTLFHHALAKLCIKAKATKVQGGTHDTDKTSWDVTLEDIKVTNTFSTGTLTLNNADPSTASTPVAYTGTGTGNAIAWTTSGTASDITMANTSVLTTDLAVVLAEQSVLPQTLTDNAKLTFTLHIITKYNGTQYSEEKIPVKVALNTLKGTAEGATPITAWEMNTKYTYNIIVNPETTVVKFDPAVVDWVVETNEPTYTVPENL